MSVNGLGPYPAYRDSGVEWLGKVPVHWEVRRLKTMVSNTVDPTRSRESGQFCLALENVESWTGRIRLPDDVAGFASQLKSFQTGDILFGKLRPYLAKVTRPERDGACVGEFLVLRALHSNVIPSYTELVLRSRAVIEEVSGSTFGAKMPRADWMFLGGMHIPRPPVAEQRAVARFLNAADRRIQRYIRAKERLVELLEERKRALIHEAVTGRIDVRTGQPYPAYKDSGVEWLGKVPEHWSERPLKRLAHIDSSGSYGEEPEGSECVLPVATTAQMDRHGQFSVGEMPRRGFSVEDVKRYRCESGDILIVKSSGSIFNVVSGKAGIVDEGCPEFAFSNFLLRVVADRRVIAPRLLFAALNGWLTRERVKRMVTGSTYPNLRVREYVSALLPIPLLREQTAIARYLDNTTATFDRTLELTRRQIGLVQEYRTRLIADVVTGKLNVREAAARITVTDPRAGDRDRADAIRTESDLHSTAHDMMKEASA